MRDFLADISQQWQGMRTRAPICRTDYRAMKSVRKERFDAKRLESTNMRRFRLLPVCKVHRRTGRGGGGKEGGSAAPPAKTKIWVAQVFRAAKEIWAKPVFKDVFKLFC